MRIINKFLDITDFKSESFMTLKIELDYFYSKILKKKPHPSGSKNPSQIKIHWSRDWEYPWAILASGVGERDRILDCGCGGSPILPFLSKRGCIAYGVDPILFKKRRSIVFYYYRLSKTFLKDIKRSFLILTSSRSLSLSEDKHKKLNQKFIVKITQILRLFKKDLNLVLNPVIRKKNNLKRFTKDPNRMGFRVRYFPDSLDKMRFQDNFFDKVFCISVIEHLPMEVAYRGIKEMVRVLKKGGLLVITLDNDGPHVNSELIGKFNDLIKHSGLTLFGSTDFTMPDPEDVPGTYNVLGFILKK